MILDTEDWRDIPGRPGYQASTMGRLRSLDRLDSLGRRRKGKVLAMRVNNRGYLSVSCGRSQPESAHAIVAECYLGRRPKGLEVNHINGIKTDNRPENLEYVSGAENMRHAKENGLMRPQKPMLGRLGEANSKSKPTQAFIDGEWVTFGGQREASRRTGITSSSISAACLGKLKSAGGIKWRFAP